MAKYSISKHQSWHILVTFEIFLSSILLTERNVCWNSAKNADLSRRLLSKDLLKNDGLISGIEKKRFFVRVLGFGRQMKTSF